MGLHYLRNVTTLRLDAVKCIGCGRCTEVCPHGVLRINDHKKVEIDKRDLCMECGGCAKNCPASAITVNAGVGCAGAVIFGFFSKNSSCGCGKKV